MIRKEHFISLMPNDFASRGFIVDGFEMNPALFSLDKATVCAEGFLLNYMWLNGAPLLCSIESEFADLCISAPVCKELSDSSYETPIKLLASFVLEQPVGDVAAMYSELAEIGHSACLISADEGEAKEVWIFHSGLFCIIRTRLQQVERVFFCSVAHQIAAEVDGFTAGIWGETYSSDTAQFVLNISNAISPFEMEFSVEVSLLSSLYPWGADVTRSKIRLLSSTGIFSNPVFEENVVANICASCNNQQP